MGGQPTTQGKNESRLLLISQYCVWLHKEGFLYADMQLLWKHMYQFQLQYSQGISVATSFPFRPARE